MNINLSTEINSKNRKREVRNMKIYWAVYHYYYVSKRDRKIAKAIGISVKNLRKWRKGHPTVFDEATEFWSQTRWESGSLKKAQALWAKMIHDGLDLFPSENAIDALLEKSGLRSEETTTEEFYQIGLEGLKPRPRRFIWIHDLTAALFAIGMLIG